MGFSDLWFLDFYLFAGTMLIGFALFFAFIGVVLVAVEGRKAWTPELNAVLIMFTGTAVLWPLGLLALPFVFFYRVFSGK